MPWFRSKPKRVHAEQFVDRDNPPRGVQRVEKGELHAAVCEFWVITAQGSRVYVSVGEWIVDEGCGTRFYPIADAVFKGPKGYDPE